MRITFPHMGNTYVAVKAMFEDLGHEVVVPPKCSKRTLEIGTKYSPETICLPLKINIGNYIESIEKGAETILITGSCGPCRFGYYSVIQKEILKDLGYDVEIIVFDPPDGKPLELAKRIMKAAGTKNVFKIVRSFQKGRKVLEEVDNLVDLSNTKRAYANNPFEIDSIMNGFYENIEKVHGVTETMKLIKDTKSKLRRIKVNKNKKIVKIGIVGEIYTVIEPFVNLEIEKKLGHMGVLVDKSLTPTKWVNHNLIYGPLGLSEEKKVWKAAKPYLSTLVGGHGRETVGSAVLYAKENYDGIIQLLPFTCMPEIVAESILPTVQKDYNIPILTLIVDELTGEAGYLTRLEAFVDLLRKRREEKVNEGILSGS
ncbi:acyl-CoA dehydratase activase-related protein [Thermohalobacter berrensis]|uniref:CoA protein activase n=1 Tax=Thermohalobacter berrensis TaxID=99594 RepID=A0A419T5K8_9FIRM|nr:acyl-CoA dehydratase activase-related protein [Thermohalobacter berrensis]RKD32716.1 CoA protein activase [Thermohalobacter berrensis]